MEKHLGLGKSVLLVFCVSFFFISSISAQEMPLDEMLQTVQRAGEEIRALQFQMQRVLGPMLPPEEIQIVSTLRFGMRGEEVRALQELLRRDREIYPEGLVTGYFGALTENAVRRFQKAQGLNAVGIVDSWTRAYLRGFSRVAPLFFASEIAESVDAVSIPPSSESVLEVRDAALSEGLETVSTSTSLSASTSTIASTTTTTSTVSSGGSGGGGSPTVQSSGSSGGSGGSSPTPSAPSGSGEIVLEVSTSTVATSTVATSTVATSTVVLEEQFVSTSTLSLSVDSATSTGYQSSTTVSIISSTVVTSLDDYDNDDDDDTGKKAEKKVEKEGKKNDDNDDDDDDKNKDVTVFKKIKVDIKEISPRAAEVLGSTSTVSRSGGAFGNLASVLSSLSGLLDRMSLLFR